VILNLLLFGSLIGFDQCAALRPARQADAEAVLQLVRAQPHAAPMGARTDAPDRRAALFN